MIEIPDTFNLASALVDVHLEAGRGERAALRYEGRTWTYADTGRAMNRAGGALRELGVEIEDRVAIVLPDSPEFVACFLGAIKIGAVPVPLSTVIRPSEYHYMIRDSRAKVVVTQDAILERVEPAGEDRRYLRHVVVVGERRPGTLDYAELVARAAPELDPEPTSKDDVCFWQYSSGTTGFPKAAVHLQHDLLVVAECYGRHVLGINANDRAFSAAKLSFSFGLGNSLVHPFRVGATTILYPGRPDPASVFRTITAERPTLFFAVPTLYAALLAVPEEPFPYDLSSLRLCVSAGEALPPALYHRWKARFGVEILDGIGSTEVGHIFISNVPGRVRPGTSGELVPGYEAKIVDDDGRPVPPGTVGNLMIKGDSTCVLYWNKHEKTKRTIQGEWISTGDRYAASEDGYYTYAGRSDDMIKVAAIWVSPAEVEAVLLEHAAVLECAVVGRHDADELQKPAAYVVLKDGVAPTASLADELVAHAKARLASYKVPRWIEFVAELPKTSTGKIQRYRLRQPSREQVG